MLDRKLFGEPLTSPSEMRELRFKTALADAVYMGLNLSTEEKQILKKRFDEMSDEDVFSWMKK